jgi:hypothetical protein
MDSLYTPGSRHRRMSGLGWSASAAISASPVSTQRLSLTANGHIRYALKTPYRDGTTQVVLEPLDFMARLAALIPSPRVNLTRYRRVRPHHGCGRGSCREGLQSAQRSGRAAG